MSIKGIHYYDYEDGSDQILVAWKNGVLKRDVGGNAWSIAQGLAASPTDDMKFETFLDRAFLTSINTKLRSWNGLYGSTTSCVGAPQAKFVKAYQNRLYLYNIKFGDNVFNDRVWFSDFPKNNLLTWGLEYGTNLAQTADSKIVTSTGALFEKRDIKVGDPFTIVDGPNAGEYIVAEVNSNISIDLTEAMSETVADSDYWVGGNFFDVNAGDGEEGNGIGIMANELFLFKESSLWRFNATGGELRQVKSVVGTSSPESVISHEDYIYWYHRSGIYRSNGSTVENISHALDDVINSVDTPNLTVAWVNSTERTINFKLNDATVPQNYVSTYEDLALTYPVLSFEIESQIWTIKNPELELGFTTRGYSSQVEYIYGSDYTNAVFRLDQGNYFENSSKVESVIPFEMEFYPIYPVGSDTLVDFNRIRLYIMGRCEVKVLYRLYYKATGTGKDWSIDADWRPMLGSQDGERSEWHFPIDARASGIQLKITENSRYDSFTIEKIMIYHSNPSNY